jgi:CCR4-NOT transcription complex subunit 4
VSDSDSEDDACPLCLDELDLTDRHFKPCRCGYQICRFCWNRIMEESQSLGSAAKCPACRSEYTGKNYSKDLSHDELLRIEKRRRDKAAKKSSSQLSQSTGGLTTPLSLPSSSSSSSSAAAAAALSSAPAPLPGALSAADRAKALRASTGSSAYHQQHHHARGLSADASSSAVAAALDKGGAAAPIAAMSASSLSSSVSSLLSSSSSQQQLSSVLRQSVSKAQEDVASGSRKNLNAVRVIQRNLVYVTNIATTLAKEDVLKRHEYFGQYGRIVKIVVNRGTVHHTAHGQSVSAYVTFHKKADALACILAVDGASLENRVLRASFGTTKYCNFFLRGIPCSNPECMYLHEIGDDADSFTKEDMQGGKSNFYEQIHAANMISKVAPPALAAARRKTFLPPAGTVSGGFRMYGPKMNPERSGPAPLTLANVAVTTTNAAGKRTISTPNSAGAALGAPAAAAARGQAAGSAAAAAAAAAAQSTWGTWTVPTVPRSTTPTSAGAAATTAATTKSGGWASIASKGLAASEASVAAAAAATAAAAAAADAAAQATPAYDDDSVVDDELDDGELPYSEPPPFIDLSQADWPARLRALLPHARVRFCVQANPLLQHRGMGLVEPNTSPQPASVDEVSALLAAFLMDRRRPYSPPQLNSSIA